MGKDLLLNVLSEKELELCCVYDTEGGKCKDSGRLCDGCYENSLKKWNNEY